MSFLSLGEMELHYVVCGMFMCLNEDGAKSKYLIKDLIIISP